MGLDFSHSDASWSYSGFCRFRAKLANEIGIDLLSMRGFGGTNLWPKDDIVLLLNHSDCDGELTPSQCRRLAPRLLELIKNWDEGDYDKRSAMLFAKDLMIAANNNQTMEFC